MYQRQNKSIHNLNNTYEYKAGSLAATTNDSKPHAYKNE